MCCSDCCSQVLNAEGATLDPLKVLQYLSDDMPLELAHDTLCRMLSSLMHRRRHLQVMRHLSKGQNLTARISKVEALSERIVVTDETSCKGCSRRLGSKVFYRYPSGAVLCDRCVKPSEI